MSVDIDFLSEEVLKAAALRMPFGKFEGTRLIDLPEPYVVWFKQQGFPRGRLGQQMALIYEIKANGLEKLIRPLLEPAPFADSDNKADAPSSNTDEDAITPSSHTDQSTRAPGSAADRQETDAGRGLEANEPEQSRASPNSEDNAP